MFYPSSRYEAALGKGATLSEAEIQAYASLARRYGMNISIRTEAFEKASSDGVSSRVVSFMDDKTGIRADHELLGVRTAEQYQDPGSGLWTVLAVQDKKTASALIGARLSELQKKLQSLLKQADNSEDPIKALCFLRSAAQVSAEALPYSGQLEVLGAVSSVFSPEWSPQSLLARAAALESEVSFSAEGEVSPRLIQKTQQILHDLGYKISEKPSHILRMSFVSSAGRMLYGLYILPYELRVDFLNPEGKKLRVSLVLRGKSQGENESDALRMADLHLSNMLSDTLKLEISAYGLCPLSFFRN